uniref:Uncharacterized protein n=1 Tax=viral metagenome TaxID=1070528 RepID=A0A6C0E9L9_9ZZZZ
MATDQYYYSSDEEDHSECACSTNPRLCEMHHTEFCRRRDFPHGEPVSLPDIRRMSMRELKSHLSVIINTRILTTSVAVQDVLSTREIVTCSPDTMIVYKDGRRERMAEDRVNAEGEVVYDLPNPNGGVRAIDLLVENAGMTNLGAMFLIATGRGRAIGKDISCQVEGLDYIRDRHQTTDSEDGLANLEQSASDARKMPMFRNRLSFMSQEQLAEVDYLEFVSRCCRPYFRCSIRLPLSELGGRLSGPTVEEVIARVTDVLHIRV